MRRTLSRGCALAVLLLFSAPAFAATYRVKGDAAGTPHDGSSWDRAYLTVQAAVNAASSGDQVWIAQGTYKENVTSKSGVALMGGYAGAGASPDARDPAAYVSTIDGNGTGSCIKVPVNADSSTLIEGLTITKGTGTVPLGYSVLGGGIYCGDGAFVVIRLCKVLANSVGTGPSPPTRGGGIYFGTGGRPIVESCVVQGNIALYGAGISNNGASLTVRDTTFDGNNASSGGGALIVSNTGVLTATGCTFTNNVGSGGAINFDEYTTSVVQACRFIGNSSGALAQGGAVMSRGPTTVRLQSNVFIANTGYTGNAIYADGAVEVLNNTFTDNRPIAGGVDGTIYLSTTYRYYNNIFLNNGSAFAFSGAAPGAGKFHNNCFFGNTAVFPGGVPALIGVNGNIEADPKLRDAPNRDIHLTAASPCINAGDPAYKISGDVDIDGQLRVDGAQVDIGADELQAVLAFTTQPGSAMKGQPLGPQPVVSLQDTYGATMTGASGSVIVVLTPGTGTTGAVLTGVTTVPMVNGVASFSDVRVSLGGNAYSLYASDSEHLSANSVGFNVTIPVVRVSTLGNDHNEGSTWEHPKLTVGAGLASADKPSGQVWVRHGRYSERVTLPAGVRLLGGFAGFETSAGDSDPKRYVTTLDGGGSGSVVSVTTGAASDTWLSGFTLSYGSGKALGTIAARYYGGGGIYMKGASPSITHNVIEGNLATIGAGIYIEGGAPRIQYNIIRDNVARCTTKVTGAGGGIAALANSTASILDNLIANNRAALTNPLLGQGGSGGGVACASADITLRNNTIAGNQVFREDGGEGGAIYLYGASPTLISNIVSANDCGLFAENSSRPVFRYNDISNNGDYDSLGVVYPFGFNGNISSDPRFVSPTGRDFHIATGSPCLDAGDTFATTGHELDLDGNLRVIGGAVDIGAYEVLTFQAMDVAEALRRAAGLHTASLSDAAHLDVWPDAGDGRITLGDALRLMRKVQGLEANP